ncbi:MAG TPA: penicillin-binding protein 1A [Methylomirabilota bacterium]|nr:penicillin-binding protein 1A [Methylomirabilota bacterium]
MPARRRPALGGGRAARFRRAARRLLPSGRVIRWVLGLVVGALLLVSAGVAVAAYLLWPTDLPPVRALEEYAPSLGSKVYADDDELLTEFQAERRIFVPLQQIPRTLRNAMIAVEDARFYSHYGVDVRGISRAAWANFRHGRVVEGGSTITQQLAKVLFLTPDRRFSRKVKEALLAFELERRYSKDRLLELYLNQIYLGHGTYGVEAASRLYFGKSVQELRLPEVSLLAALPRSPGHYSPFEHPELAQRRRGVVLARMVEQGYIAEADAQKASRAPLGLVASDRRWGSGQYFLDHLQEILEAKFGSDLLYRGGLSVYTTLDPLVQRAAEQALQDGLQAIAARHASRAAAKGKPAGPPPGPPPEGAVVVIEAATGYVKALVGGASFAKSEFNRAIHARRQPGSAFKPFVFLAALEAGRHPSDLVDDTPVRYARGPGSAWEPDNYDGQFRGPISLQEALEHSVNVATVKLAESIGIERVIAAARRLGIQSRLPADLTLALGSGDVTLLELTAAYAGLANQGVRMEPILVRYVTDSQGRLIEESIPEGREVVSSEAANTLTHMLRGVIERGTGAAARVLGRPLAGKTGTTNDFSNAWFVGYTPSVVTGVWVGHDRLRSLGHDETGARAALPIWIPVMRAALRDRPVEDFPAPEIASATREPTPPPTPAPALVPSPPPPPPQPVIAPAPASTGSHPVSER